MSRCLQMPMSKCSVKVKASIRSGWQKSNKNKSLSNILKPLKSRVLMQLNGIIISSQVKVDSIIVSTWKPSRLPLFLTKPFIALHLQSSSGSTTLLVVLPWQCCSTGSDTLLVVLQQKSLSLAKDKRARLIIRLSFKVASDSLFVQLNQNYYKNTETTFALQWQSLSHTETAVKKLTAKKTVQKYLLRIFF